jgi:large subunit ribosomal protein L17
MRHRLAHRKLNRDSAARKALLRGLATQLIEHGFVVTTIERAKELRGVVEPLIALAASEDNVNNRRKAAAVLYGKAPVGILFKDIGPRNVTRHGGYTRTLKLGFRPGDHARRALIELVETVNPPSISAV